MIDADVKKIIKCVFDHACKKDEPVTKKGSKLEAQDSQELVIVYKVGGPIITQDAAKQPETSLIPATRFTQQVCTLEFFYKELDFQPASIP